MYFTVDPKLENFLIGIVDLLFVPGFVSCEGSQRSLPYFI
jgi:hypothetical protein